MRSSIPLNSIQPVRRLELAKNSNNRVKGGKQKEHASERRREARAFGMDYIEKPYDVYIQGPGEAAPKRAYFRMGRSIHRGIVAELSILGISQQDYFRWCFLDLYRQIQDQRKLQGLPPMNIDPTAWINPDRVLWAKQRISDQIAENERNGVYSNQRRRKAVYVHENTGTPFELMDEYKPNGMKPGRKKKDVKESDGSGCNDGNIHETEDIRQQPKEGA